MQHDCICFVCWSCATEHIINNKNYLFSRSKIAVFNVPCSNFIAWSNRIYRLPLNEWRRHKPPPLPCTHWHKRCRYCVKREHIRQSVTVSAASPLNKVPTPMTASDDMQLAQANGWHRQRCCMLLSFHRPTTFFSVSTATTLKTISIEM